MATLALSILIVLLSVGGLAIGVLCGRPPIKGSCGGLACGDITRCTGCCHDRSDTTR